MPPPVDARFVEFARQIGLREENAIALWNADIQTPQELASHDVKDIKEICNNPLLINIIMPELQKNVFAITMAEDPFKTAVSVLRKLSGNNFQEEMETDAILPDTLPIRNGEDEARSENMTLGTQGEWNSATAPFLEAGPEQHAVNLEGRSNRPTQRYNEPSNQQNNNFAQRTQENGNPPAQTRGRNTYQNTNMVIGARGTGAERIRQHQNQRTYESDTSAAGSGNRIQITGGNFVQTNLFGKATYENVNSEILTTLGNKDDLMVRRKNPLNSSFYFNGELIPTSDLLWRDDEFWLDTLNPPPSTQQQYNQHFAADDVYQINNWGHGQALVLNNIHFGTHAPRREGADKDTQIMNELASKMGFITTVKEDKTRAQVLQSFTEFSKTQALHKSSVVWVFIGSHGERSSTGKDVFLGTDGQRVDLDEIMELFSNENCPALRGKPKIFMLQFCRKDSNNQSVPRSAQRGSGQPRRGGRTQMDANYESASGATANATLHRISDMIKVFSTLPGQQAYRDTTDGSWFVTAIAKVFEQHYNTDDLLSLLTKVNSQVSLNTGRDQGRTVVQLSQFESSLTKKLFFFSGLNQQNN